MINQFDRDCTNPWQLHELKYYQHTLTCSRSELSDEVQQVYIDGQCNKWESINTLDRCMALRSPPSSITQSPAGTISEMLALSLFHSSRSISPFFGFVLCARGAAGADSAHTAVAAGRHAGSSTCCCWWLLSRRPLGEAPAGSTHHGATLRWFAAHWLFKNKIYTIEIFVTQ